MALSIKDPELERLARRQAKEYGISITQAIINALRENDRKLAQEKEREIQRKLEAVRKIQEEAKKDPGYEAFKADIKNLKAIRDAMWE